MHGYHGAAMDPWLDSSGGFILWPLCLTILAVIMLHGLGDTGNGWSEIASDFQSTLKHVKFVFPTAPSRPITLNMGMKMPGWYDIASLEDINQKEDAEGLHESKRWVGGVNCQTQDQRTDNASCSTLLRDLILSSSDTSRSWLPPR